MRRTRSFRALSRRTADERSPRLLLLDPDHWDAFEWLAAALRHRGWDVVRLMSGPEQMSGQARFFDRMVFGGMTGPLPRDLESVEGSLGEGDRWLAPPTVDVQGPEDLMARLRRNPGWPTTRAGSRVADNDRVPVLYDKWSMHSLALRLGVEVPDSWPEPPDGVFPIVVKGRTGSGGKQVRVAADPEQLVEAVYALDPLRSGQAFYQTFEPHPIVNFGGVADRGRILAGSAYRAMAAEGDELGPPERIEIIEHRAIEEQIAVICRDLRYSGFLCADFLSRPDGSAALIDFNPRVFGAWLAMQKADIDILGAYLSLFGDEPAGTAPSRGSSGGVRMVRHVARSRVGDWSEWRQELASSARQLSGSVRVTGGRYAFAAGARSSQRLAKAGFELARRRR